MISSDMQHVFQWWLTLLILGTGFLPLTFLLFRNFFDKGYIFSKLIALAVVSYTIFLTGILHIAPFTQITSYVILLLLAVVIYILVPGKKMLPSLLKQHALLFLCQELFFLAAIFFWSYIRSFQPDIHGLEKYMDYGFVNSILRTEYFPPKDMWFTPFSINYYYFGHLVTAVLTKLSGIPSAVTFNLMLATLFALCLTETFSIGANLSRIVLKSDKVSKLKTVFAGILSASLVTLAGNLHIIYAFFKPYQTEKPVPPWQLLFSPLGSGASISPQVPGFPNSYWYPNATRFIYNTIHEFPIYSWVVSDLHGHVLDIPFVLLMLALLLSILITPPPTDSAEKNLQHAFKLLPFTLFHFKLLFAGFLLAVMYMTNAWDGGIYLLLSGLILFYLCRGKIKPFLLSIGVIAVSLAIFSYPYSHFFKPFASGIGILCSPEFLTKIGKFGPILFEPNHCQHSPWWQLLILYGFFYFFVISFIIFAYRLKKLLVSDVFIFILIILSTFLIVLPEFIYLKDIYPAHFRANTMFKLVFQAFIMLSLASGYIIFRIFSGIHRKTLPVLKKISLVVYALVVGFLLVVVHLYPYLAVNSYYGIDQKNEKGEPKKPTGLDGTKYLQTLFPDDFMAITWINKNIKGQPVILEAQGDSYTDYARISANTGLPTVLGWTVHEWLWRGDYSIPSPRIAEITTMYETKDTQAARSLLKKYNVQYVFIGSLEYQKYPGLSESKFADLGVIVFQSNNTKVYKLSF